MVNDEMEEREMNRKIKTKSTVNCFATIHLYMQDQGFFVLNAW